MKTTTYSYRQILALALPLIMSGLGDRVIQLTDTIFSAQLGQAQLAAIGVGVLFYALSTAICSSFAEGAQNVIGKSFGEGKLGTIATTLSFLVLGELLLSCCLFAIMKWVIGPLYMIPFLAETIPQAATACWAYLAFRFYGLFFISITHAFKVYYNGTKNNKIISIYALIITFSNIILNYVFIFGKFGLPEMGIAGAGLASSIADFLGMLVLVGYFFLGGSQHKKVRHFFFKISTNKYSSVAKRVVRQSLPLIGKSILMSGAWFMMFYVIGAYLGEEPLAISNLVKLIYAFFGGTIIGAIAKALQAIVSNLVGENKQHELQTTIHKTIFLSLAIAGFLVVTLNIFTVEILNFITGFASKNQALIPKAIPLTRFLGFIIFVYTTAYVLLKGLEGTGATAKVFWFSIISVSVEVAYILLFILLLNANIFWVWASEIVFWSLLGILCYKYLKSKKWIKINL